MVIKNVIKLHFNVAWPDLARPHARMDVFDLFDAFYLGLLAIVKESTLVM